MGDNVLIGAPCRQCGKTPGNCRCGYRIDDPLEDWEKEHLAEVVDGLSRKPPPTLTVEHAIEIVEGVRKPWLSSIHFYAPFIVRACDKIIAAMRKEAGE